MVGSSTKPSHGSSPDPPMALTEVTRSFAFKLNAGNYESRDFFCSQKIECEAENAEEASAAAFQFCVKQVQKDVADYKKQRANAANPSRPST